MKKHIFLSLSTLLSLNSVNQTHTMFAALRTAATKVPSIARSASTGTTEGTLNQIQKNTEKLLSNKRRLLKFLLAITAIESGWIFYHRDAVEKDVEQVKGAALNKIKKMIQEDEKKESFIWEPRPLEINRRGYWHGRSRVGTENLGYETNPVNPEESKENPISEPEKKES